MAGLKYPLVTVLAGPGYGKTTAVMDFCRETGRKLFWLHLLPIDNDPERFWSRCNEALQPELSRLSMDLSQSVFPGTAGEFYAYLKTITKELYAGTEALVVLDSAENVTNPQVLQFISSLINLELENMCIFFISNNKGGAYLDSLLGSGRHFQIGAGELQFNKEEIRQLFEHYGVKLSKAECAGLLRQTGGWPLALHLIASHPDKSAYRTYGKAPHLQVISDLFEQNYFAGYTAETQAMLVKLSFFDGVALGLIRAITPQNARKTVEELSHNIFIYYEYNRNLFYFQRMYHDFLMRKQAILGKEEIRAMYSSAGDWFCRNGNHLEALECYWQIADYERFLSAILTMPRTRTSNRSTNLVLDRLKQMPEEFVRSHIVVDFICGYLYMNDLKIAKAKEMFLSLAERLEKTGTSAEDKLLLGDVYVALVDIAFAQNAQDDMEYIWKALPLLPEGSRIHSEKMLIVGNNEVFFLPDNRPGRLNFMCEYIFEFMEPARRLNNNSGKGLSFLFAAEGAYCAERFEDVMEYSTRAILAAIPAQQGDIAANAMYAQIRLMLYEGNCEKAEEILEELVDYIDENHFGELYDLRDCAAGMFYILMNDIAKVPAWISGRGKLAVGVSMDAGRDRIMCALFKYLAENYEAAYEILMELDEIFIERRLWTIRLVCLIAKAACLLRMGRLEKAIPIFWQAYDMTWQNDIVVFFAEFGDDAAALIEAARNQQEYLFDGRWLERVYASATECNKRRTAMRKRYGSEHTRVRRQPEKLSPREMQVLKYLSQGLSRKDIQVCLGISLHGVKKHITGIYNKLGAINRVDAIHIAVANGLLEL